MAAVLSSLDSHLFELRNFKANELLHRERHSKKTTKPAKGSTLECSSPSSHHRGTTGCDNQIMVSPSERMSHNNSSTTPGLSSPSRRHRGTTYDDTQIIVSPSKRMSHCTSSTTQEHSSSSRRHRGRTSGETQAIVSTLEKMIHDNSSSAHMAIVESPLVKPASTTGYAGSQAESMTPLTISVESRQIENMDRALALRSALGGEEEATNNKDESQTNNVLTFLDEATLKKLAKMVAREVQGMKKKKVPVRLDDFTGEKSPYLAESAIVWLNKLRLAARQNEWDNALALEVASVHLKGLAARWFASIEKHLNEELHLDRDRWNYFQSQFEERFADFRSRLLQIEKIKDLKLKHAGEDVREYAEAIMSMNSRLEEPLDDEFLRWVFIQGLPPSELRDKVYKFEEKPHTTMAGAVKYARRFQLSQSVFNIKDSSTPRMSPVPSTPARSVRSN